MTPTPEHLRKMREGRLRAQRERERDAIHRVRQFTAWLKAGSVLRDIPRELPTDADYAIARKETR